MRAWNVSLSFCIVLNILFFGTTTPVNSDIDENSIVAIWLFDESNGKVAHDSSKNGNDAEFYGNPEWVDGKFGKALWFNGSTDYVAAPNSDSLDINGDKLSIVAWVNGEEWPAANHVVRKVADQGTASIYILRVQPETVRVYMNTNAGEKIIDGATVLPTNKWIHLAMVYNGKEVRIYVNGKLDGSGPVTGDVIQSNNELRIGRGEPAGYFHGTIDEVAIFASALTEKDIQNIMETGLSKLLLPVELGGKLFSSWAKVKASY